jgi:hypothetical protein
MEDETMKLNPKIYAQLTGEPFETQIVNGKNVAFHFMNDTPFLYQFASRGRFAIWTSDGKDYKVLIENKYYDALKDFYTEEVNSIWLNFLDKVAKLSRKMSMTFLIPTVIIYMIVGIVAIQILGNIWPIIISLIFLVLISNMIQSRIINQRVRNENTKAQDEIRQLLGQDKFNLLVDAQEEHYKEYFKFEEDPQDENLENSEDQSINESEIKDHGNESN